MRSEDFLRRASTLIAAACVVMVAVTVTVMAVPGLKARLGLDPAGPVRYHKGEHLAVPDALYASTPRTLLVFGRNSCSACQLARPVLAGMTADLAAHPDVRVVVVTGTESPAGALQFATDVGVDSSRLYQMDLSPLHVPYVPAVLLVDRRGTVILAHEGVPTEDERRSIVQSAISGTSLAD